MLIGFAAAALQLHIRVSCSEEITRTKDEEQQNSKHVLFTTG